MRAALLPTPGDPFVLAYWLRNYETWREHVDELVVFVNGQTDPAVIEYDRSIIEAAGGRMIHSFGMVGHDGALRRLLHETQADYVVLCEDDAYVRKPAEVDEAFCDVEINDTGIDIVASPRHEDYAGQYVAFGTYVPGDLAELRHGMWPAFLFAKRLDLVAVEADMGDRRWNVGDYIEGWGVVTPEACEFVGIAPDYLHLDTFFAATFRLRAAGLRTRLVHHVRLFDAKATEEWLAEDPPWFHVTGVSTLSDALTRPVDTLPDMDDHGGLWTRRLAWWLRTVTLSPFGLPEEWRDERKGALTDFYTRAGVRREDLLAWTRRFADWAEVSVPA